MQYIVGNVANVTTVNKSDLRFVWKRLKRPDVKIKMTKSRKLWRLIDYDKDLIIYCPDWTTNFTKYEPVSVQLLSEDFLNRGDVNFVVWKWLSFLNIQKTFERICFSPFFRQSIQVRFNVINNKAITKQYFICIADYIDKAYFESAYNTEIIGQAIAETLEELGGMLKRGKNGSRYRVY